MPFPLTGWGKPSPLRPPPPLVTSYPPLRGPRGRPQPDPGGLERRPDCRARYAWSQVRAPGPTARPQAPGAGPPTTPAHGREVSSSLGATPAGWVLERADGGAGTSGPCPRGGPPESPSPPARGSTHPSGCSLLPLTPAHPHLPAPARRGSLRPQLRRLACSGWSRGSCALARTQTAAGALAASGSGTP